MTITTEGMEIKPGDEWRGESKYIPWFRNDGPGVLRIQGNYVVNVGPQHAFIRIEWLQRAKIDPEAFRTSGLTPKP